MRILKFEGATMRDAIAKVKAELGDQAVVIATRQIRRGLLGTGIEISAAIDDGDEHHRAGPLPSTIAKQDSPNVEELLAPLRTERQANTDFLGPFADRVSDHTVDP